MLGLIISSTTYSKEYMSIAEMKVGLAENPLGLDTSVPRFGWQLVSNPHERGIYQTAYRLEVKDEAGKVVWNSGKVTTDVDLSGSGVEAGYPLYLESKNLEQ